MIDEGDTIEIINGFGSRSLHVVHRVTKLYAFVRWNEHAEGKFRRGTSAWGEVIPVPRPKWDRSTRKLIKK